MNKVLKYTSIFFLFSISVVVGIFAIIYASTTAKNLSLTPQFDVFVYLITMITLVFSVIALLFFLIFQKKNTQINIITQNILLILIFIISTITIITYLVINNTCHFEYLIGEYYEFEQLPYQIQNHQIDNFLIALFYDRSLVFLLLFSFSTLLLHIGITTFSNQLSNKTANKNDEKNTNNQISEVTKIKNEIEDMKQAIELKKLKEEYSKLYNELNSNND
jgi:hypothetical protein